MSQCQTRSQYISIHAPREGGDVQRFINSTLSPPISIHAPREGGDHLIQLSTALGIAAIFQSTPPARGATAACPAVPDLGEISIHAPREGGDWTSRAILPIRFYFNPRPPRGGRRRFCPQVHSDGDFNPRPPRGGRRLPSCANLRRLAFQSTPPARGATSWPQADRSRACISIHAPREGGDNMTVEYLSQN